MLLRFSARNYLSIAEVEEISLVASNLKGPECSLVPIPGTDFSLLPSAIIYGANASGKTNCLKAFSFLRSAVLESHARGNPEGGVPRKSFKLDPAKDSEVTSLEVEFLVDNVRFQYGFECNDDAFTAEWLYAYPEGKRRRLFERTGSQVEFGSHFKGPKKILVDLMRDNSLFISTATQNDHEELSKIVSFFRRARFSMNVAVAKELINNTFKKDQVDPRTIEFLKSIGTGITGFRQTNVEIPESVRMMVKEFTAIARKHVGEVVGIDDDRSDRSSDVAIEFAHAGVSGEECYFGLERESSGTRRLVLMMNTVFKALDEGNLVMIDELDASLHTFAAAQIIELFQNPEINKKGAQLIATTHDTNLLNLSKLRRDQIWFCEKDDVGKSHIFALADMKSRPTDNFEQGYLEGRYGAIPYSGDLVSLFES
ncbi:AAA family ATPase [Sphingomonas echinoides]|uniref:AAA family ATPase n=1 Tax=Sphingomonas echinoides TaxID=59803 RepID=UPI00241337B1|nr:ATP-binding protein [Sphingomonas echinoides]